jgi:hypothetical protein
MFSVGTPTNDSYHEAFKVLWCQLVKWQ